MNNDVTIPIVEDLITLPVLDEASLLENIKVRFLKNYIYTNCGTILVSVNPYIVLPIYSPSVVEQYVENAKEMPPHIFAVADRAYKDMRREGKNQSVLISGESGAGKTEATKLILQYLAAVTNKKSKVEQQILEASPILEAFGNAKTVRNNNSSRFGRFSEIQFGSESTGIVGARIVDYLLEKSRIVYQAQSERNYHIFYQLLAGATPTEKNQFKLKTPNEFHYLNQSGCVEIEGEDDGDNFENVRNAFSALNIDRDQQFVIFSVLAGILHIGDITFTKKGEGSEVANLESLNTASNLLGVDPALFKNALTTRSMNIRGQVTVIPLKVNEAVDCRDALSKALYGSLFRWLVKTINITLSAPHEKVKSFIGILDIFGFEHFKVNSFEQLMINYANERLQQHFNQHIFKLEEEEYRKEKIDWKTIEFVDNQDCLDLIEKRPIGILAILDEECRFPKATDDSLLSKLHQNFEKVKRYEKPRLTKTQFAVDHFAGKVPYEVAGFLDKNKDTLQDDLKNMIATSAFPIVRALFPSPEEEAEAAAALAGSSTATMRKAGPLTVGAQFKSQLTQLMTTLGGTGPHFVRCIKPNTEKKPNICDDELIRAQLRYAGMLETIRIRKLGYPQRYPIPEFYDRYKIFVKGLPFRVGGQNEHIESLLNGMKLTSGQWLRGLTKIFLKDKEAFRLSEIRELLFGERAIEIQATWRMYFVKSYYKKILKSALHLQTVLRGSAVRKNFRKKVRLLARLQSSVKMFWDSRNYYFTKRSAISLQSFVRMYHSHYTFQKRKSSAVILQTVLRMTSAKQHYHKRVLLANCVQPVTKGFVMRKKYKVLVTEKHEREERQRREEEERRREEEKQRELARLAAMQEAEKKKAEEERLKKERELEEKRRAEDEKKKMSEEKKRAVLEEEKKRREEELKRREEEREREKRERILQENKRKMEEEEFLKLQEARIVKEQKDEEETKRLAAELEAAELRKQFEESSESETESEETESKLESEDSLQSVKSFENPPELTNLEIAPTQQGLSRGTGRLRSSSLGNIPSNIFQKPTAPPIANLGKTFSTLLLDSAIVLSKDQKMYRGNHFWMGHISENVDGVASPPEILTPPASPEPEAAKSKWSLLTLRARRNSTAGVLSNPLSSINSVNNNNNNNNNISATTKETVNSNSPVPSPRGTLRAAPLSVSTPRSMALAMAPSSPSMRNSNNKIFSTLRSSRSKEGLPPVSGNSRLSSSIGSLGRREGKFITVDAPYFPLYYGSNEGSGNQPKNSETTTNSIFERPEEPPVPVLRSFQPKSQVPALNIEVEYSWVNFVRKYFLGGENDLKDSKGKKHKIDWQAVAQYSTKLASPLLPTNLDENLTFEIFESILLFMGNKVDKEVANQDPLNAARFILDRGMKIVELRSEIYCEVIKQIVGNPSTPSVDKGWELLAFLTSTFLPENEHTCKCVITFCQERIGSIEFAGFCLNRIQEGILSKNLRELRNITERDSREVLPSLIEMETIKQKREIYCIVQLPDSTTRSVLLTPWMTCGQLLSNIETQLSLNTTTQGNHSTAFKRRFNPFGIYEAFHSLEKILLPQVLLWDVISKWELYGTTMVERNVATFFSLIFKKYLYIERGMEITHPVEILLEFHQAVNDVHRSLLPCREEDFVKLAALLYVMDMVREIKTSQEKGTPLTTPPEPILVMERFIPKRQQAKYTSDKWRQMVLEQTNALSLLNREGWPVLTESELRDIYRRAIEVLPLFGSALFRVQYSGNWPIPPEFDVAINRNGLIFLEPITKDKLRSIAFTHIEEWKFNSNTVTLKLNPDLPVTQEYESTVILQSIQSEEICKVIDDYISALRRKARQGIALVDHNPTKTTVPFKKGCTINVFEFVDNDKIRGEFNGRVGVIPIECVQLILPIDQALIEESANVTPLLSSPQNFSKKNKKATTPTVTVAKVAKVIVVGAGDFDDEIQSSDVENMPVKKPHYLKRYAESKFKRINSRSKLKNLKTKTLDGEITPPLSPSPSGTPRRNSLILGKNPLSSFKPMDIEFYDPENRLTFSKEPLSDSLLEFSADQEKMNNEAINISNNLLKIMGDQPHTSKDTDSLMQDTIQTLLNSNSDMQDEFFCQLIKQLTYNPNKESLFKGLEFFYIVVGCFVPSSNLLGDIEDQLDHLYDFAHANLIASVLESGKNKDKKKKSKHSEGISFSNLQDLQEALQNYANAIKHRMNMSWHSLGARAFSPSMIEINAARAKKPIQLPIQISYGQTKSIKVEPWTTVGDAYEMIVKAVQLEDSSNVFLYYFINDIEKCLLNDNQKVMDLVSRGEKVQLPYGIRLRPQYLPTPLVPKDIGELDLYFYMMIDAVIKGRYPLNPELALTLGALQVQAIYGDYNPNDPKVNINKIGQFISAKFLNAPPPAEDVSQKGKKAIKLDEYLLEQQQNYTEELAERHSALIGMPTSDAKNNYLRTVSKWKFASANLFLVQAPRKNPSSFFLAVDSSGLHFLSLSTLEPFESYNFSEIANYSCNNGTTVSLKLGSLVKLRTMVLEAMQGPDICININAKMQEWRMMRQKQKALKISMEEERQKNEILELLGRKPTLQEIKVEENQPVVPLVHTTVKKPAVPALQLNRAKIFNFE